VRVGLYARVSTEDQAEGLSLDAQLRALRLHAAEKGHEVVEEFVDAGYSATTDKRPAFQRMIAAARAHLLDAILIHKLDRFSRNLEHAVTYRALLRREGVTVISITEPSDDSPASFVTEGVLQVLAAWYSKNLAQEVAKGRRERYERGLWNGNLPFGYKRGDDGRPEIEEKEAAAVREAYSLYAGGRHSYQGVADWLNGQGFRTRNVCKDPRHGVIGPSLFTKDTVRDMLRNPFYRGAVTYKGKDERPGLQSAIVDESLWQAARQAGQRRHHAPTTFLRPHRTYLLAGLLRCACCGGKLWAHSAKNGRSYYREYNRQRGLPCTSTSNSVATAVIDAQVSALFEGLALPPDWRELLREMLTSEDRRERILAARAKVLEKLHRLRTLYLELALTDGEYQRERGRLQEQLQALVVPDEEPAVRMGAYVEDLPTLWRAATLDERRAMVLTALDAVYVDMDTGRLAAVQPKADFLPLLAAASPTWGLAGKSLLLGDPEGIRTPDLQRDKLVC
jgi:site-specific DNA recombinase